MSISEEQAETRAIEALGWLVGNQDLLGTFMGSTGASVDDLKTQASDPVFLGSVLDFILMDDAWVTQLCDSLNWPYEQVQQVRWSLRGGAPVHWT